VYSSFASRLARISREAFSGLGASGRLCEMEDRSKSQVKSSRKPGSVPGGE
jgi:hypothetical protein